ncbi:MAG: TetR/AcrR family transcriptional regulator [Aeromicrobium sp.]
MSKQTPGASRAERQAQTREKLIEVARDLFIADGYAATSLDKVAEAAGFSKGAVYSNFSGKEELCMEVLDAIHADLLLGVVEAFTAETDFDGRIEAFTRWARLQLGNPLVTALEAEFSAAARQSPYLAEQLRNRHRAITAEISRLLRKVVEEAGYEVAFDPDKAAVAVLSLGIGVGAMRSLDAKLDVDIVGETMRTLLRGVTRPARVRAG